MTKKMSITGTKTPPQIMKRIPAVGGFEKFEITPGGGFEAGIWARTESGIASIADILGIRPNCLAEFTASK